MTDINQKANSAQRFYLIYFLFSHCKHKVRHHRTHVQIRFVAELPIVEIDDHRRRHEYKNEYYARYHRSVADKKRLVYCQMHSGQFAHFRNKL